MATSTASPAPKPRNPTPAMKSNGPPRADRTARILGWLVVLAGVAWTLHLAGGVDEPIFFSGDGGLKYLNLQQIQRGHWGNDIVPPDQPWVRDLWARDLGPFKLNVYVHHHDGRYLTQYLITLAALAAPFEAVLGPVGMLVPALLGAWLGWVLCVRLVHREMDDRWLGLLVIAHVIFATPLTVYAALFWEHTLGALFGLVAWLPVMVHRRWPTPIIALCGLAGGLCTWLRPEAVVLPFILLPTVLVACWLGGRLRQWPVYFAAQVIGYLSFIVYNKLTLGSLLGLAPKAVTERSAFSILDRFRIGGGLLFDGVAELCTDAPLVMLAPIMVAALIVVIRRRDERRQQHWSWLLWLASGLVTLAMISLVAPNLSGKRIGPRYLFVVLPVLMLAIGFSLNALLPATRRHVWRWVGLVVLLVMFGFGFKKSTIEHGRTVERENRQRIKPALVMLRERPEQVIVGLHQYEMAEISSLLHDKVLLRAETREGFSEIVEALNTQEIDEALFYGYSYELTPFLNNAEDQAVATVQVPGYELRFQRVGDGRVGWMYIYRTTWRSTGKPRPAWNQNSNQSVHAEYRNGDGPNPVRHSDCLSLAAA